MSKTCECPNKKCGGNFSGECRQPYLACNLHLTIGTKQQIALENLLKENGKDYYKEYQSYLRK